MKFIYSSILFVAFCVTVQAKPQLRLSEVIGKSRTVRQVIDFGAYGALPPTEYRPAPYIVPQYGARIPEVYSTRSAYSAPISAPKVYSAPISAPKRYYNAELEEENLPPQPFHYSFDTVDEFGTQMTREEAGDAQGTVTGSYTYRDAQGLARIVRYIADHDGFRAEIQTNEPGTETSSPADATIISSQPSTHK